MDDDKKLPPESDNMFDEHELDLNTPDDLEAVGDVTFSDSETPAESTSIFDEFDDFKEESQSAAFAELEDPEAYPLAENPVVKDDFSFGDDQVFDFSTTSAEVETADTDEEIFSSDAFEDVNAAENLDFPEETTEKLGDSQLFDYDPGNANSDSEMGAEDIYSEAPPAAAGGGSGGKSGKGDKAAALKGLFKNRKVMRFALMFVLVGVVYGLLRVFTGGSSHPTMEAASHVSQPAKISAPTSATAPSAQVPGFENAAATAPVVPAHPGTVAAPVSIATHEVTKETTVATAPHAAPGNEPATGHATPAAVAAGAHGALPALPAPPPHATVTNTTTTTASTATPTIPAPETTLNVTTTTVPSDQIADKLSSLQASITAIDDRLNSISGQPRQLGMGELSPGTSMTNPFGNPQLGEEQILKNALHKIENIDKKVSHIADLETQLHMLSKEIDALKGDVVQQSMIVGTAQAAINQTLSATIDMKAPKMMVQAAIPGRAWLRSETGQLLTVIPGDEVAGYGRVVSIDPTTGTVVMSSRAVFRE